MIGSVIRIYMRGEVTLRILDALTDIALVPVDVFEAMLSAGYGASIGKLAREHSRIESRRAEAKRERELRRSFYVMLSKLKKEGLIESKEKRRGGLLSLTKKGKKALLLLRKREERALPHIGSAESGGSFIIVAFDIPERERRKRDWLRETLRGFGLAMIQRSVWIGKVKLPQEFINTLQQLNLLEKVEIFEINKTGTLRHLA